MTIGGALSDLNNLLKADDIPFYYKPSIKAVMDTIALSSGDLSSVTPQESRWIPVSERLPEEDGQYLITVKYKPEADYENIYAEHGEWINGRWDMFCFGHCGEVEDIIAWMPLPQPYKAESEARGMD